MRPRVISHMIMSLDGRLQTQRWATSDDDGRCRFIEQIYESAAEELEGDAWLIGRRSVAGAFKERTLVAEADLNARPEPFKGERLDRRIAIVMDPSGRYRYDQSGLDEDHLVVVLGTQVDAEYLRSLREAGVSYVFAGDDGRDVVAALDALGEMFAISRLLLEGGGTINGAFLAAGCIDEVSTLIYPVIDGVGSVPSIYHHAAALDDHPHAMASLELISQRSLEGGLVWLRYRVTGH